MSKKCLQFRQHDFGRRDCTHSGDRGLGVRTVVSTAGWNDRHPRLSAWCRKCCQTVAVQFAWVVDTDCSGSRGLWDWPCVLSSENRGGTEYGELHHGVDNADRSIRCRVAELNTVRPANYAGRRSLDGDSVCDPNVVGRLMLGIAVARDLTDPVLGVIGNHLRYDWPKIDVFGIERADEAKGAWLNRSN